MADFVKVFDGAGQHRGKIRANQTLADAYHAFGFGRLKRVSDDLFITNPAEQLQAGDYILLPPLAQPGVALLTAYVAVLQRVPVLEDRSSPRGSASTTVPAWPRTFSDMQHWDFEPAMDEVLKRLDDTNPMYQPVTTAGRPGKKVEPAGEECEVRAPLQMVGKLLNDIAEDHGIKAKLLGGGSNRSLSRADYIARLLPASSSPPMPQQQQPEQSACGVSTRQRAAEQAQAAPAAAAPVQRTPAKRQQQQQQDANTSSKRQRLANAPAQQQQRQAGQAAPGARTRQQAAEQAQAALACSPLYSVHLQPGGSSSRSAIPKRLQILLHRPHSSSSNHPAHGCRG